MRRTVRRSEKISDVKRYVMFLNVFLKSPVLIVTSTGSNIVQEHLLVTSLEKAFGKWLFGGRRIPRPERGAERLRSEGICV